MKIAKSIATVAAVGVMSLGIASPAAAQNTTTQRGGAVGGLVAAVVNANVTRVEIVTVDVGNINVALTNVLNNNRILTDFLNNNNVTVTDVVDVTIVGNTLVIAVLGTATGA